MDHLILESKDELKSALRAAALPCASSHDLDPLMDFIGDAKYVLLGEASHGTHEYYTWRMRITKRLLEEKDFTFIAVEGDWPDCYRLNRYIKGYPGCGRSAKDVLQGFNRWPTWMWANWEMDAFAEYLRKRNDGLPLARRTGFYGLDVYSLYESLDAILDYLKKNDGESLDAAKKAMRCFSPYGDEEGKDYASATALVPGLCREPVVNLLTQIRLKMPSYNTDHENVFSTEQNALVAVNAEKYYNAMIRGGPSSWNIRDRHMMETLDRLMEFHGARSKCIVWAHNTHIGDARATDMAEDGMVNLGELATEAHAMDGVVLVGFGSYHGKVIAGRRWNDVMRRVAVPAARRNSWEHLLHESLGKNALFMTERLRDVPGFASYFGHRAIGVVYNPEYEHLGNYVPTVIPQRYDAFIYLENTRALHPLHIEPDGTQVPETYPFGF